MVHGDVIEAIRFEGNKTRGNKIEGQDRSGRPIAGSMQHERHRRPRRPMIRNQLNKRGRSCTRDASVAHREKMLPRLMHWISWQPIVR